MPHAFVAPRTPLERDLVEIWADVLGIDGIGVEDHFIDLGGDSLVATRVFLRVQESCAAQVSLADLLAAPTIAALATFIEGDEYCAIDVAIGDEVVTMRMSEADFKRYGLPEGARNFRLLRTGAAEA